MAVRLLFVGGSLGEVGGYGRLVVIGGWWLWGRLIALMGRICLICRITPISSPICLLGFSSPLKTETAIRDFGWLFALVCYEKFERTLKLHSFGCCFTKHDLYRESIEIIFFRCLGFYRLQVFFWPWHPCLTGFVFVLSGLYLTTVVALFTGDVVSMVRCCSVSMVAESV